MRFARSSVICFMATLLAMGPNIAAIRAQEPTSPVAVVSVSPLGGLFKETSYLLQACNVPELSGMVTMLGNQYTQGIDQTRPIVVAVHLQDQNPSALICIPMTDRSRFFDALGSMGIEPDDLGDGMFEINANGQALYAKDRGEWMFVAQFEDALGSLPEDPASLVGRLPNNYSLAVQVNVRSLPEELKAMIVDQVRIGFERGMSDQAGQSEEEREVARQMGEMQIAQLEQVLNETERAIIGLKIDQAGQVTYMDTAAQFVEGSKFAAQMDALKGMTSAYTNFKLPYSSASFRATTQMTEQSEKDMAKQSLTNSVKQAMTQLDNSDLPPEAKQLISKFISGLVSVTEKTIDEGKFDGAGSMSVADDTLRILVGGRLADGRALEQELKDVVAGLPAGPDVPKAEFDYEVYKGITLHRVTAPVKIADPGARKVFGDSLLITVGTSEKVFLLALDPAGDEAVKAAIDAMESGEEVSVSRPVEGVIEMGQILRFAQSISPNPLLESAVRSIEEHAGNDKVEILADMIPRGVKYRFSVDEGIMRSIGAAAKAGNGGGGF